MINVYEFDTGGLNVISLKRDADWFDYIFQNRRTNDTKDADVIIGPIANDTIYDTYGMISSGFIKPEDALNLLLIGPEYTQVAIKSETAVSQLTWLEAEAITDVAAIREEVKREEEAYQAAFSAYLQEHFEA